MEPTLTHCAKQVFPHVVAQGLSPWAEGMVSGSTGDRGALAGQASAGGSGVAPRSCHSHLCLLFFRDPDSDLREEEEAEMKATS